MRFTTLRNFLGTTLLLMGASAPALAQQSKLVASDGAVFDGFGTSVSLDGEFALVGSVGDDPAGSAYIFRRSGSNWFQQAKLTPPLKTNEILGQERTVGLDGNFAVLGTGFTSPNSPRGSVYVYRFNGSSWQLSQTLIPNKSTEINFGRSVSISGNTLFVGVFDFPSPTTITAEVYVFQFNGSSWVQTQIITGPQCFGWSMDIDSASGWATIFSWGGGSPATAFFYQRSGSTWILRQTFGIQGGGAGSVAIHGDAAALGTIHINAGPTPEVVDIFRRNGNTWTKEKVIRLASGDPAHLGFRVALDKDALLVGGDDTFATAKFFLHNGSKWTQVMDVAANDPGNFPFGPALSLQAGEALLGVPSDNNGSVQTGAAFVIPVPQVNSIALTGPTSVGVGTSPFWNWSGAPANAPYSFLMSGKLRGSLFQGHPIDVGPGVKVLATGTTTASGTGSFTIRVPRKFRGKTGNLEVVVSSGGRIFDSNPVTVTVF
ncbi:MAG: FG-GAP repeat protein [Planctomycetota bacterium]